jgi:Fur family transcriptional regulator, ferric uptake regulator
MITFATMLQKEHSKPTQLLKANKLNHTRVRETILAVLAGSDVALSANEISSRMEMDCDRVTLYRNLKTFVEKGIIHQIFIDHLESKYVLPERDVHSGNGDSEHIHFKCIHCSTVQCLHDYPVAPVELPEGFEKLETNYVIFGLCNTCNLKDES